MSKKLFCFALCAMLFALSFPAEAQQAGKVYRIGYLSNHWTKEQVRPLLAFRQGMRDLGYVRNLLIERYSGGFKQLPDLAAELVRLKVEVIVTSAGPEAIRAAQQATRTIPIVMAGSNVDPVEAGFVDSFARPGGNVTGLTNLAAQLHPKQLELLKEAFPRISRVAILWPRAHKKYAMKKVEAVGQALGIEIQRVTGGPLDDLENVFSAMSQEAPNALLVASMPLTLANRAQVVKLTAKRRLPTIYDSSIFVDAGGLMSYGVSNVAMYRRTATFVDKILKGAKPADLPVEQPSEFELIINLKTAKALGVTIPSAVLLQATKVIK